LKNNDGETAADVGRNDEVKHTISKAADIRAKKIAEDEEKLKKEREEKELKEAEQQQLLMKSSGPLVNTTGDLFSTTNVSLCSPRSSLVRAQLVDKDVEIIYLKDQLVKMYSKMSFLESENESLRRRVVSLEQQQLNTSTNSASNNNMTNNSDEKFEALGIELQQLKEQNLQLKSTLKSVLNNSMS